MVEKPWQKKSGRKSVAEKLCQKKCNKKIATEKAR